MDRVRGIVMLVAAGVAFYSGWRNHTGQNSLIAYGLGVLALGLGLWHLTRKTTR